MCGTIMRMCAWSDKPLEDKEFPDERDLDAGADDEVLASLTICPNCERPVHDQTQQCPGCKQWITPRLADWRTGGKWYVRGGLWAAKTLLLNWAFWLGILALSLVILLLQSLFGRI